MIPILVLFLGGLILTIGDIVMKKWVSSNNLWIFILGIGIWLIGLFFLALSFKYKNIAVASVIFIIFNVVTLYIANWLLFKESISTLQTIGIITGMISVVILELAEN